MCVPGNAIAAARNLAMQAAHRRTAGLVREKYHVTMLFVNNDFGATVPVAFFIHTYQDAYIIESFLNNLAIFATNSPRPITWPSSPAAQRTAPVPDFLPVVQPTEPVVPCCPAFMVIDVSATETCAAERTLWGNGFQGHGLPRARFHMRVIWCIWHLLMAWYRNIDEKAPQSVKSTLRKAVTHMMKDAVAVRSQEGPCRRAPRTWPRNLPTPPLSPPPRRRSSRRRRRPTMMNCRR